MAGITDLPFRMLCMKMGAGMTVSEMVISNPKLWNTRKSRLRMHHSEEIEPRSVQIAGSEPEQMAHAALYSQQNGAQIIDINMGCPAKKVCKKAAGSALLKDTALVGNILKAVIATVDIPVTLKIRTGWDHNQRNGVEIAQLAESLGVDAIAVHGRTRACMYQKAAEYETIAQICQSISIPVIANGDITTPEKTKRVLNLTGAQGIMVGRAAQGRPWIFREINHYLKYNEKMPPPSAEEIVNILLGHIKALYRFYGDHQGVRIARKHVGWYMCKHPLYSELRKQFNSLDSTEDQIGFIKKTLATL